MEGSLREYNVHIEMLAPPGRGDDETLSEHVFENIDEDGLLGVSVSQNLRERTVGLTFNVMASGAREALRIGVKRLAAVLDYKRVTAEMLVELEAEPYIAPELKELINQAEIARRLGVSRARITQLAQREDFPAPTQAIEGQHSLWRWGDIADWEARRREPVPA